MMKLTNDPHHLWLGGRRGPHTVVVQEVALQANALKVSFTWALVEVGAEANEVSIVS